MKNKQIFAIIAVISALTFILGIFGIVSFNNKTEALTEEGTDTLIGMYITTEYLNDDEASDAPGLNYHTNADNTAVKQNYVSNGGNRIYAQRVTEEFTVEETGEKGYTEKYVFPESLNGWGIYQFDVAIEGEENKSYSSSVTDDIFCNCELTSNSINETETENIIKATIYTTGKDIVFYQNPVYQRSNGDVYVVAGEGMHVSGSSYDSEAKIEASDTVTITDKQGTKKQKTSIILIIKTAAPVKTINVIEMDKNNCIVKNESFEPGKLPQDYYPQGNTEYIIVETVTLTNDGEKRTRQAINYDEFHNDYFDHYETLDNGMYKQHQTYIEW